MEKDILKEIVNRAALYVTPKEPFIKWAKYYDESPEDDELKDRISEKHVFLIEEFYLFSKDGISEVLEPYWERIFEYELPCGMHMSMNGPSKEPWKCFLSGSMSKFANMFSIWMKIRKWKKTTLIPGKSRKFRVDNCLVFPNKGHSWDFGILQLN